MISILRCTKTFVYVLIFTLPASYCVNYYDGYKMRADNLQEYGERLSSLEDEGVLKLGRAEKIQTTVAYDVKVNEKSEELNTLISTRCTTDKEIEIGGQIDAASNVDGEDQTLNKKIDEEFVTKVYIPPKSSKQPNHFVDDI